MWRDPAPFLVNSILIIGILGALSVVASTVVGYIPIVDPTALETVTGVDRSTLYPLGGR